jgi:hypothetical protein
MGRIWAFAASTKTSSLPPSLFVSVPRLLGRMAMRNPMDVLAISSRVSIFGIQHLHRRSPVGFAAGLCLGPARVTQMENVTQKIAWPLGVGPGVH